MFESIAGNSRLKGVFSRLVSEDRLPASLLLVGPEGIGKKRFALELARSFVCRSSEQRQPCGKCPACKRSQQISLPKSDDRDGHKKVIFSDHPDIGLIEPYKRFILVDAVRDLEREAFFRPFEASARTFVIDDAHKMNDAASNALLKTLEEPPSTTRIFLVSSRPSALNDTIRSRCQVLRFAPLDVDEIEAFLDETGDYSASDAALLARIAGGSIGNALSKQVDEIRDLRGNLLSLLKNIVMSTDRAAALRAAEELGEAREEFEERLATLQTLIHDIWLLGSNIQSIANEDIRDDLSEIARHIDTRTAREWIGAIEDLRSNLNLNLNKKIASDALLVSMATASS